MVWGALIGGALGLLGNRSARKQQERANEQAYNQTRQAFQDQLRGNNPNMSNPYGTSTTTFGPDGQPTITQQYSPLIQALFENQISTLSQGPAYHQGGRDPYYSGMLQNFGGRMGQRAGFSPPEMNYAQPSYQAQKPQLSYDDPKEDDTGMIGPAGGTGWNGVAYGPTSIGIREAPFRLKGAQQQPEQYTDLIKALMGGG